MFCCQTSVAANQKERRPPSNRNTTVAEIVDRWQSANEKESKKPKQHKNVFLKSHSW